MLTLRDLFAVHAPPAPAWFEPKMREPKPQSIWKSRDGLTTFFDERAASHAVGFNGYADANAEAIVRWHKDADIQRMLQWPYAWAEQQAQQAPK